MVADSIAVPTAAEKIQYERAIAKSKKVMEVYPKAVRWHDDALFTMGKSYLFLGQFGEAIVTFNDLQKRFPGSKHIALSWYYLAQAYFYAGMLREAEIALLTLQQQHPAIDLDDEITVLLAQISIKNQGRARAIQLLEKMINNVDDQDQKLLLVAQLADLYLQTNQPQKALHVLGSSGFKPYTTYEVDIRVLQSLQMADSLNAALDHAQRMHRVNAFGNHYDRIEFEIALIHKQLAQQQKAIDEFVLITEKYDTSSYVGLSWHQLGQIYAEQGEYTKAFEAYEQAALTVKDSVLLQQVRSWISSYKKIDTLKTAMQTQPDTASDTATLWHPFEIGELYWLELNEADSALVYYNKMLQDTLSTEQYCRTLLALGALHLDALGDSSKADSILSILIETYSNPYAQQAQRMLGREVTIQTDQDRSHQLFREAERALYIEDNPKEAVRLFAEIYKQFPDLPIGRKSLLTMAWIFDEKLFKKRSAKELYERICKDNPDDYYCNTYARPRLESVEAQKK